MSFTLLTEISSKKQLDNIKLGGVFLGSGGGGPISAANSFINEITDDSGKMKKSITVLQPTSPSIENDKYATAVCFIGSPAQASDIDPFSPLYSFNQMGDNFIYPLAIEAGGANSLVPILVAAHSDQDLKLIDGDGVGRSVPSIQNTLFANVDGVTLSKTIISSSAIANPPQPLYSTIMATTKDKPLNANDVEKYSLDLIKSDKYGNEGGMTVFCVENKALKDALVEESFSEMNYFGKQICDTPLKSVINLEKALLERNYKFYTFKGKVTTLNPPKDSKSLDKGSLIITDSSSGDYLALFYLNENLVALKNQTDITKASPDNIWAMAPDLISYMVLKGHDPSITYPSPVSNVEIKLNDEVIIFGLSAKDKLRNNKTLMDSFLEVFKKIDFPIDQYIPIEKLKIHN